MRAALIALICLLMAPLPAKASGGIGLSPAERGVRISGAGDASAEFLLFNPADRAQRFALLLPEGVSAEPVEGVLAPGERVSIWFTISHASEGTYRPRILLSPVGEMEPLLTSSAEAVIRAERAQESEEEGEKVEGVGRTGGLLTGMALFDTGTSPLSWSFLWKAVLGAVIIAGVAAIALAARKRWLCRGR